jgi:hypothetical protein
MRLPLSPLASPAMMWVFDTAQQILQYNRITSTRYNNVVAGVVDTGDNRSQVMLTPNTNFCVIFMYDLVLSHWRLGQ